MSACKDPDPYIPSGVKPTIIGDGDTQLFVNSKGNYTKAAINQMAADIAGFNTTTVPANPVAKAVSKYGEQLYVELNTFNNTFIREDYVVKELPKFEYLGPRMNNGPMTDIEFASFLESQGYTPFTFGVACTNDTAGVLDQLDGFFAGAFSLAIAGGLCGTLPNIFGAINSFFDKIGQVGNLLNDALSFLSKIKNIEDPIKALFEKIKVKALIEAIKDKLVGMFDAVVNQVKKAIQNFDLGQSIQNIAGSVLNGIHRSFLKIKEKALAFFDELNIDNIRNKLTGLFDYAVGLFANPSIGEIQFLISRFCGLLTGIEDQINQIKQPLQAFVDNLQTDNNALTTQGNAATAQVIAANGVRTPTELLEERINNQQQQHSDRAAESIRDSIARDEVFTPETAAPNGEIVTTTLPPPNVAPANPNIYTGNVRPIARPFVDTSPITPEETNIIPTFEDLIQNRNRYVWIDPVYSARYLYGDARMRQNNVPPHGQSAWTGCDEQHRLALMRTLIEWDGPKVQIVSAYRSREYNYYLKYVVGINGVALNSEHVNGKAFDLDWGTYPAGLNRLRTIAYKNNFWGHGIYTSPGDTFLHIDRRPKERAYTWNS